MVKLLYKPVGMVLGMITGALAAAIFNKVWGLISDEDPQVDPEQRDADWPQVILSAVLSGAIYAAVQAVIRRAGAIGFERATGEWPGTEPEPEA